MGRYLDELNGAAEEAAEDIRDSMERMDAAIEGMGAAVRPAVRYESNFARQIHGRLEHRKSFYHFNLPYTSAAMVKSYKNRFACENEMRSCVRRAYDYAKEKLSVNAADGVFEETLQEYAQHIWQVLLPYMERIKVCCRATGNDRIYQELEHLFDERETELRQGMSRGMERAEKRSGIPDYAQMCRMASVEKRDYRISDEHDVFFRMLETLIADNVEYQFDASVAVDRLNQCSLRQIDYFLSYAGEVYEKYIEKKGILLDAIGQNLPDMQKTDEIMAFLKGACRDSEFCEVI